MNNKVRRNSTEPVIEMNKYKTDRSNQENNHNSIEFDAHLCDRETETKLTIFGHAFSMSEFQDISRFATTLELIATRVLRAEQQIPDGAIFIMKVTNKEMQVSFGGLLKK